MPATNQKISITISEKAKLEQELDYLVHVEKPQVLEELQLTRSQGDLSENADYDAAREHQGRLEARITEIQALLNNAIIIDEKATGKGIGIGSKVRFEDLRDHSEATIQLKGHMSADPLAEIPAISVESPLGKALETHLVGDVVLVEAPEPYEIKVLSIEK